MKKQTEKDYLGGDLEYEHILSDKINLMRSGAASKISYTAAERAEANI